MPNNVCPSGQCEGVYYIDRHFCDMYKGQDGELYVLKNIEANDLPKYSYDEDESYWQFSYLLSELVVGLKKRFSSFRSVNKWVSRTRRAILENDLFYLAVEDNEWSFAIELLQKDEDYSSGTIGLQTALYKKYLDGIERVLKDLNGEVSTYAGPYCSATLY